MEKHIDDNHILIDHSNVTGLYKSKDKIKKIEELIKECEKDVVIDGIADNFDSQEITEL